MEDSAIFGCPIELSPKPFCTFAMAFVLYLSRSRNTLSHFFFGIRSFAVWGLAVLMPVLLFHCISAFHLISLSLLEQILAVVLFSSNCGFCIFFYAPSVLFKLYTYLGMITNNHTTQSILGYLEISSAENVSITFYFRLRGILRKKEESSYILSHNITIMVSRAIGILSSLKPLQPGSP